MPDANGRYILNGEGDPELCPDLLTWARWMEDRTVRRVAYDELPGDVTVSTVFLGLDHSFGHGPPILWETMIFGGPHDQYQERYMSRADAMEGHAKALTLARAPEEGAKS